MDHLKDLPEACLAWSEELGEVVYLVKGMEGYYPSTTPSSEVEKRNREAGITPAQVQRMLVHSMFGWKRPINFQHLT